MRLLCCRFMLNLRIDVLLGRSMLFYSIIMNIQQGRVILRIYFSIQVKLWIFYPFLGFQS
ncbi:hypothetical protein NC653_033064 [Populus alba x Populus x berolinensis]|uniref:Uncharacterized protein n=1 Tax=Populus alba x Populus x berolinensis TaxID=444605 RepID=A0AAD6LVN6_9ROSI|nr:hypothetical protein NC653_033064 [Populus alba x Populus x berolinensis]